MELAKIISVSIIRDDTDNKLADKKGEHTFTICIMFLADLMRMGIERETISNGTTEIYMEE